MKKKVMIGMSGGVDSSVAALLLKQMGYDVTGITMKLRPDKFMNDSASGGCCSIDDVDDARRVCYKIGIDHIVLNFTEIFSKEVIDYFVDEYKNGKTPNPCIACNSKIKFQALLDKAIALGFDYIATGHYAVIDYSKDLNRYLLYKSRSSKDQSYVLYGMTQHQLSHTLFPLENMQKSETRKIAEKNGLIVANKPDSQEICFVPDNDYASFIENYTGERMSPGNFVDASGNVLGLHQGLTKYTVGQRKGLGMSFGKPMYVSKISREDNTVILGDERDLYSSEVIVENVNFIPFDSLEKDIGVQAKIRYQAKAARATLSRKENGTIVAKFDSPQRAVTPGQAIVFYNGDLVVGGGTIA